MKYTYQTTGVCAKYITFEKDENGKVSNVEFYGGCNGNLKAIGKLVNGMDAEKIAQILKGNTCGYKATSCADQLAIAVTTAQPDQA